jgi:DNA-binding CsgD family transcriptional regulator
LAERNMKGQKYRNSPLTLTRAERIAALLRSGSTTAEICRRLRVTPGSVRAVKAHITMRNRRSGRTPASAAQLAAPGRAIRTAIWAHTMVKWLITKVRSKRGWEIVNFTGRLNRESAGIVDLLAIRKDHTRRWFKNRGDAFEIILIQVKGGGARRPNLSEVGRLRRVSARYHARAVVLAEWKRGTRLQLSTLAPRRDAQLSEIWIPVAKERLRTLFR